MDFFSNENINIASMILCIVSAIGFIYAESENIADNTISSSSFFCIIMLILIGFVPILNIMTATVLIILILIHLLASIFNLFKND